MRDRLALARRARVSRGGGEGGRGRARVGRGGGRGGGGRLVTSAIAWRAREGTEKLKDSSPPPRLEGGAGGGGRDLCMCVEGGDRREE